MTASARGKSRGRIPGGGSGGTGIAPPPLPDAPVITSFGASDTTLVEGDTMDATWTLSGDTPTLQTVDWGDGSGTSTITPGTTAASHDYDIEGTYTATLSVSNSGGSDSDTITGIDVAAPSALAWKSWAPLTSMTETRRNQSGRSVTDAPVVMPITFSAGEVPTTKTLQLRDPSNSIIPTTDWQFDERSTYPDGSLRHCIIRVHQASSWSNGVDRTFTIETVTGSWPALTSATTTSLITSNSDFEIVLSDVRTVGPNGATTTTAYTHPTLTFTFNTALGLSGATKVIAGPVCDAWETWGYFQGSGPTNDTEMWCKARVIAYKVPGTSTISYIQFDPLVMNGWARVRGLAKIYKMAVYDGATLLRDFSEVITVDVNDINPSGGGANASVRFNRSWDDMTTRTERLMHGHVVKVGTSPHSPLVAGDFHQVSRNGIGGNTLQLTLNNKGVWGEPLNDTFKVIFTTANTSSFTLEKYMLHCHTHIFPVRDEWGELFVGDAGAAKLRILPYYSTAEKKKRMETGQFRNFPLGATNTLGTFNGVLPNGNKNTSGLIPGWDNYDYHPGVGWLTQISFDEPGGALSGALHIGEADDFVRDFVQDMEEGTQDLRYYRRLRTAAAECASLLGNLSKFDNATNPSTSREYATQLCINNGSDDAGTQYTGMGPCYPFSTTADSSNATRGWYVRGTDEVTTDESNIKPFSGGGEDGSHTPRQYMYCYSMFGDWSDLELTRAAYGMVSVHDIQRAIVTPGDSLAGNAKTYDGDPYYRISIVNWAQRGQSRHFIAASHLLAWALLTPDYDPTAQMYEAIAEDNVTLLETTYDDPAVMGDRAKATGGFISSTTGGWPQHWQVARHMAADLYLVKMSGITAPNCVRGLTAFSRLIWGDPVLGDPMPQHIPGNIHGLFFSFWDNIKIVDDSTGWTDTDSDAVQTRFLDAAATVADGSTCGFFPGPGTGTAAWQLSFLTDGATARVSTSNGHPAFIVGNGDRFQHSGKHSPGLPSGMASGTWFYVYDRVLSVVGSRANASSAGDIMAIGETITQGGNTATVTFSSWTGSDNYIRHTKPTPGDFVDGAFTASIKGARVFNDAMFQLEAYDFKVSTTPGPSYTQQTWTTASQINSEDDGIAWLCESGPVGEYANGRLRYTPSGTASGTMGDYLANCTGPLTMALHLFGTESGCLTANDAYEDWIADAVTYEGITYGDLKYSNYSAAAMTRYQP